MSADVRGITFISDHYFFLRTTSLTPNENRKYRRVEFEKQVKKALIKFSTEDTHILADYFPEGQDELISWLNIAISECSKRRNQIKVLKSKQKDHSTCNVQIPTLRPDNSTISNIK